MLIIGLLITHWYASLFFQTFFLHRYCSHKMFSMNKFWERTFYLLTWIFQGASFLHPSSYAKMHMLHHKHSDTENDPHSPISEPNLIKMMIKTYNKYMSLIEDNNANKNKSNLHFNDWPLLDKFSQSHYNTFFWLLFYVGLYYSLGVETYYYPFIAIHLFMGPIQGAIVNYAGHKIGYSNYNLADNSKNTLFIDFLLMGELYQNNHHKNGKKLNFAHRWFEVDITFYISHILNFMKIIKIKGQKYENTFNAPALEPVIKR